jgi:hypothetical protein
MLQLGQGLALSKSGDYGITVTAYSTLFSRRQNVITVTLRREAGEE